MAEILPWCEPAARRDGEPCVRTAGRRPAAVVRCIGSAIVACPPGLWSDDASGGDEVIGRPGVLARRGRRLRSASPTHASGAVPGADAVAIRGHLAEFRLHAAPVRRLGALTTDDRSAGMLRTPADWRDWMGLGALTTDDRGAGATDHPHAAATVAAVGEPVAPCAAAPGGAADGAMSAFFCRDDWTRTHEHSTLRTVHLLRNERLDLWEDL